MLLAMLSCVGPEVAPASRSTEPVEQGLAIRPESVGPTNDNSYFQALGFFRLALQASASEDRDKYGQKAVDALRWRDSPEHITVDRLVLMALLSKFVDDEMFQPSVSTDLWTRTLALITTHGIGEFLVEKVHDREDVPYEWMAQALPGEGQLPTAPEDGLDLVEGPEVGGSLPSTPEPDPSDAGTGVSPTAPGPESVGALDTKGSDRQVEESWSRAKSEWKAGQYTAAEASLERALKALRDSSPGSNPELLAIQLDMARVQIALRKLAEARLILEELLANLSSRGLTNGMEWRAAARLLSATYKLEGNYARAFEIDQQRAQNCSELAKDDPVRVSSESDYSAMRFALGDVKVDEAIASSDHTDKAPAESGAPNKRKLPEDLPAQGRSSSGTGGELSPSAPMVPPKLQLPGDGLARGSSSSGTAGGLSPSAPTTPSKLRLPPEQERARFSGDPAAADAAFVSELAKLSPSGPADYDARINAREGRAQAREAMGDLEKAFDLRRENVEDSEASLGPNDIRVQKVRMTLGRALHAGGYLRRARENRQTAYEALAVVLPPDHPMLIEASLRLVDLSDELGETEAALFLLHKSQAGEFASSVDSARLEELIRRAREFQRECRFEDAIKLRREIVDMERRILPTESPVREESLRELAALLRVSGAPNEARSLEVELCREGAVETETDGLRARALRTLTRAAGDPRYAPSVDLRIKPSDSSNDIELVALVRDAVGIERLNVVQDGKLLDIDLVAPVWTPDADGLGGRLVLRLRAPTDLPVSVISVEAENAAFIRALRTEVAPGKLQLSD